MKKAVKWKARTNLMIEDFSAVEGDGDDGQRSHQTVEATMRGIVWTQSLWPSLQLAHLRQDTTILMAAAESSSPYCTGRDKGNVTVGRSPHYFTSTFESWQLGRDRSPLHVEFTIARKT